MEWTVIALLAIAAIVANTLGGRVITAAIVVILLVISAILMELQR